MLFLVVGTPWKAPRSSRFCCPDCGDGWFGGLSSTKTATLRMRLRNSYGSESSASSTTLMKVFALHPSPTELNQGTVTPSSRRRSCRHHHHHLPRLALGEEEHRQPPTDQERLSRSILDVCCSCPKWYAPYPLAKPRHSQCPAGGTIRAAGADSTAEQRYGQRNQQDGTD